MGERDVQKEIVAIVLERAKKPNKAEIAKESALHALGIDSMARFEIADDLERVFGVEISIKETREQFTTIEDAVSLVERKLSEVESIRVALAEEAELRLTEVRTSQVNDDAKDDDDESNGR